MRWKVKSCENDWGGEWINEWGKMKRFVMRQIENKSGGYNRWSGNNMVRWKGLFGWKLFIVNVVSMNPIRPEALAALPAPPASLVSTVSAWQAEWMKAFTSAGRSPNASRKSMEPVITSKSMDIFSLDTLPHLSPNIKHDLWLKCVFRWSCPLPVRMRAFAARPRQNTSAQNHMPRCL